MVAIAEVSPSIGDTSVIEMAVRENRLVLTEDKDFGQLVFANDRPSGGVILIRFPAKARKALAKAVLRLIREKGEQLLGSFVVIGPERVRIERLPSSRPSAPSH